MYSSIALTWALPFYAMLFTSIVICRYSCPVPCACYYNRHQYVVDCSHRHLEKVPQGLPSIVSVLLLNHNALRSLAYREFENLRLLTHLDLSDNEIEYFNESIFQNLDHVTTLVLKNNKLQLTDKVFSSRTFIGLNNLKLLNLKHNSAVNSWPGLKYPGVALATLTSLEELLIDGLENKSFGEEFKLLKNLRSIDLSGYDGHCSLNVITGNTFKHLESLPLSTVNISNCNLTRIDEDSLSYFHNLKTLDISSYYGYLHYDYELLLVRNVTFGLRLSPIKHLFLKDVRFWPHDNTVGTKNVEYLQNTSLTHLYFDNSSVNKLADDTPFVLPKTLEYISLTYNSLHGGGYLKNGVALENLKTVVGSYQYHFNSKDGRQQDIIVSYNVSLETFKVNIPKNLENVYIDHCKLNYPLPPSVVSEPNRIRKVDLSGNLIKAWFGPIVGLHKLEDVDLSNNSCVETSLDIFAPFPNLKILRLAGNYLGPTIDRDAEGKLLKHSKQLRLLDISRNGISKFHKNTLGELVHLEELQASHNSVWDVETDFSRLTNLSLLDLSYNSLSALPSEIMGDLDAINQNKRHLTVDLSGNPLLCNCNTLKFIKWLQQSNITFRHKSSYLCQLDNKTHVPLERFADIVDVLDKQCADYLILIIVSVVALVCICVITVGLLVYRFRWRLRYLYYMTWIKYEDFRPLSKDEDSRFTFDGFICFEDDLRDFINERVIPKMEKEKKYNLCLHHRDFTPGLAIEKNISRAIRKSYRTIILLNESYLHSYWCMFEFNMARMEKFYSGRDSLVIVLMEDIPVKKLPYEAVEILKSNTYIEFPNEAGVNDQFWRDLECAMHRPTLGRKYQTFE